TNAKPWMPSIANVRFGSLGSHHAAKNSTLGTCSSISSCHKCATAPSSSRGTPFSTTTLGACGPVSSAPASSAIAAPASATGIHALGARNGEPARSSVVAVMVDLLSGERAARRLGEQRGGQAPQQREAADQHGQPCGPRRLVGAPAERRGCCR